MKIINLNDDLVIKEKKQMYLDSLGEFTAPDFIVTKETIEPVSDTTKAIRLSIKEIEARRKEITAPLDEAKKKAIAQEKSLTVPMKKIESQLKGKVGDYLDEKQRIQEKYDRELREAEIAKKEAAKEEIMEQAEMNESPLALDDAIRIEEDIEDLKTAPITKITTGHSGAFSGAYRRTIRKWRLLNIKDVPEELLIVNEKEVNGLVRAGRKDIPGIRIWEERITVSK